MDKTKQVNPAFDIKYGKKMNETTKAVLFLVILGYIWIIIAINGGIPITPFG